MTNTSRTPRFEDKVVFISGVARGQGRSHAVRFAAEGARIIGIDACRDLDHVPYPLATEEDLAETGRLIEAAGGASHLGIADVRDRAAMRSHVAAGVDRFGRLDVIMANAGVYTAAPVQFCSDEAFEEAIAINLTGVYKTVRASLRFMLEAGNGGAIIVTSSTAGSRGFYGAPAYVAAKHGVVGFMRSLALELAPAGIRVNSIHPTSVSTPMIRNDAFTRMARYDLEAPTEQDVIDFLTPQQPLGIPWVEASDISDAVLWLASDEARYVTGIELPIDGGKLLN